MAIVYSKTSGLNNAQIGKLETPIRMVIEHESDLLTAKGGIRDWLFNVEKPKGENPGERLHKMHDLSCNYWHPFLFCGTHCA